MQDTFMEGFLMKQGAKGLIRGYKKRWFVLSEGKLAYSRSPYSPELGHVKMSDCVRVVVKNEGKEGSKRYIFIIQTNFGRDYILQATTETEELRWVEALNTYHSLTTQGKRPLAEQLPTTAWEGSTADDRARRRTVMYPPSIASSEDLSVPQKRPTSVIMQGQSLPLLSRDPEVSTHSVQTPGDGAPLSSSVNTPARSSIDPPTSAVDDTEGIKSNDRQVHHDPETLNSSRPDMTLSALQPPIEFPSSPTASAVMHSGKNVVSSANEPTDDKSSASVRNTLLKRKKDKKSVSDLQQQAAVTEQQLKQSEQLAEERRQALEILNEELNEQRRRFEEEKRQTIIQMEQLKEKYFLSLVVSAKLSYMLNHNGECVNIRAPALWEQAVAEQVQTEDFIAFVARHIGEEAARAHPKPNGDKVGYDAYYSYVRRKDTEHHRE